MDHRRELARRLVRESVVLLKNEEKVLPLKEGSRIAVFGRTQIDTFVSGNGSGAAHREGSKSILQALMDQGLLPVQKLARFYQEEIAAEGEKDMDAFDWSKAGQYVNSGIMYEIFGQYHAPKPEPVPGEAMVMEAAKETDTALWILGRNAGGEECDRHLEGDYYLTDSEQQLAGQICGRFSRVILILNVNGLIDLSWTKKYDSIKGILFLGIPGEEGADALGEVLLGKASPCGKLAVTIAQNYADYPGAGDFTWDKEDTGKLRVYESYGLDGAENGSIGFAKSPVTVYREGLYLGYRYFSTFGKKPLYPFGFGLSYSSFALAVKNTEKTRDKVVITVEVKNTGDVPGKEVVQIYLSPRDIGMDYPKKKLVGWEKTRLLNPGEAMVCEIKIPWPSWGIYEEKQAAWVIPAGKYELYAGTSSEVGDLVLDISFAEDYVLEQCSNRLGIRPCNKGKIEFLKPEGELEGKMRGPEGKIIDLEGEKIDSEGEVRKSEGAEGKSGEWEGKSGKQEDKADKPEDKLGGAPDTLTALVKSLSVEQLASLCVGYGPGVPFAAFRDGSDPAALTDKEGRPLTVNDHKTGFSGYVSPAIPRKGIHSVFYKDGPAGIGQFAWPCEMLMACSFDKKLWYAFGEEMGRECEAEQVDVWLAPAMNLLRHPLGGRNFEYFSEDPLLAGSCGCEITKGVQENHPVLVCAKHFAANEQETWRRGNAKKQYDAVDSILEERTLRELYLEPFRLLVKEAGLHCVMTSFNKINGTFAGGSRELCTDILRKEWGFDGVVVTDWGDMDIVVDGADAVHAGNDIVMPGGPPVIRQILKGFQEGRVTREDMERSVKRLLCTFWRARTGFRLYVDQKPFLILGGELHNSSSSDLKYMEEQVWPYLRGLNMNTVLLPIAWENVEPEENQYDFSLAEGLLGQAEREHMRLVILWFGLWKNGESFYVPYWVKKDRERFFRARYRDGSESETISPLCREAVQKDRQAFGKLMDYLKKNDRHHTVIMIQVENEIGFLKADRDYSQAANEAYKKEIPEPLQVLYQRKGSWKAAFGEDGPEYFMAWHYARAVEEIACAGKEIYDLPMYANAWLEQHPDRAGIYPSGGPVAKLIPLWQTAAPSLDMLSPDIYVRDFKGECMAYSQHGNPLFIPETAKNARSASRVFYAVGAHRAIGFVPFGVEDIQREDRQRMKAGQLEELNIMAEAFDDTNTALYLKESYRLLEGMKEKVFAAREGEMTGYMQANPYEQGCILEFDSFDLQLDYLGGETGSAGILFPEKDGFYLTGCNTRFTLLPKKGSDACIEILRYEEGEFQEGKWKRKRILNGDERYDFAVYNMPQSRFVKFQVRKNCFGRE